MPLETQRHFHFWWFLVSNLWNSRNNSWLVVYIIVAAESSIVVVKHLRTKNRFSAISYDFWNKFMLFPKLDFTCTVSFHAFVYFSFDIFKGHLTNASECKFYRRYHTLWNAQTYHFQILCNSTFCETKNCLQFGLFLLDDTIARCNERCLIKYLLINKVAHLLHEQHTNSQWYC